MSPSGSEPSGAKSSDDAGHPPEQILLLYAGSREWFRSALEAVLQPEGFRVQWAKEFEGLLEAVVDELPDLVILDEKVGETSAAEVCRALREGALPEHVPIVLYASDFSREGLQARALEEGAWEVIREPIRAESLVASLHRLLRIAGLIGEARERRFADRESGLLSVRGLVRMLPTFVAMAEREGVPLSCAVVGPTVRGSGAGSPLRRDVVTRLCERHVRQADLCGWLRHGDAAVVTFDTVTDGAVNMARRLERISGEVAEELDDRAAAVSAGVVQLYPRRNGREQSEGDGGDPGRPSAQEMVSLLDAARSALDAARHEGGGVRIAEPE